MFGCPSENDGMTLANVYELNSLSTEHTIWVLNYDVCYSLVSLFGKCYTLMPDNNNNNNAKHFHDSWHLILTRSVFLILFNVRCFVLIFSICFFCAYSRHVECSMIHSRRLETASIFAFHNIHHSVCWHQPLTSRAIYGNIRF